jgi:hypothetical protein
VAELLLVFVTPKSTPLEYVDLFYFPSLPNRIFASLLPHNILFVTYARTRNSWEIRKSFTSIENFLLNLLHCHDKIPSEIQYQVSERGA